MCLVQLAAGGEQIGSALICGTQSLKRARPALVFSVKPLKARVRHAVCGAREINSGSASVR